MKRLIVLAGFSLLSSVYCCSSNEEKLLGSWEVTDLNFDMEIPTDADMETNNLMFTKTYTFYQDGRLHLTGETVHNTEGTYEINKDSIIMHTDFEGKKNREFYAIRTLTDKEMVWEQAFEDWGVFSCTLNKIEISK